MSETKSIKHRSTKMRKNPSFLGAVVKTLKYADKVKVISEKGAWAQVEVSGIKGWVHSSTLSEKEIVLQAGQKDAEKSVSNDEVLLASKGFSESVEQEMQSQSPGKDFSEIDRIENIEIPPEKLKAFIKEGGLKA